MLSTLKIIEIPEGELGTEETVKWIYKLIDEGYKNPRVIDYARWIVRNCKPRDFLCEAKTIFNWVKSNIHFIRDPFDIELLQGAERLLRKRFGDCDCAVVLLGSLYKAVGFPVRLVTIAAKSPTDFDHIFLQVFVNDTWVSCDPTTPGSYFGWRPSFYYKERIWESDNMTSSDIKSLITSSLRSVLGDYRLGRLGADTPSVTTLPVDFLGLGFDPWKVYYDSLSYQNKTIAPTVFKGLAKILDEKPSNYVRTTSFPALVYDNFSTLTGLKRDQDNWYKYGTSIMYMLGDAIVKALLTKEELQKLASQPEELKKLVRERAPYFRVPNLTIPEQDLIINYIKQRYGEPLTKEEFEAMDKSWKDVRERMANEMKVTGSFLDKLIPQFTSISDTLVSVTELPGKIWGIAKTIGIILLIAGGVYGGYYAYKKFKKLKEM